ncbi:MAG TPA: hypothetical protein VNT03_11725 [Baekduia sp.]|nr:hypothetical protein [Baekduia sp.]
MPDVPPDRRATHELYLQLREAGRQKAAAQRATRRRPVLRAGLLAPALSAILAVFVLGGAVALGTKVFTHDGGSRPTGRAVGDVVHYAAAGSAQATSARRRRAQPTIVLHGAADALATGETSGSAPLPRH